MRIERRIGEEVGRRFGKMEGGEDQAMMTDSPLPDLLHAEGMQVRLWNDLADFLYETTGFGCVRADASNAGDSADYRLKADDLDLILDPLWN